MIGFLTGCIFTTILRYPGLLFSFLGTVRICLY